MQRAIITDNSTILVYVTRLATAQNVEVDIRRGNESLARAYLPAEQARDLSDVLEAAVVEIEEEAKQ